LESTDTKVASKHLLINTPSTQAPSAGESSLTVPSVLHRGESCVPMKCSTRENRASGHPRLILDGLRVGCNRHALERERGEAPRPDQNKSIMRFHQRNSTDYRAPQGRWIDPHCPSSSRYRSGDAAGSGPHKHSQGSPLHRRNFCRAMRPSEIASMTSRITRL
jgi:hypothetical protein